ncbi:MAG: PAC2 family protein [SAR202 cluster bacterium]|nr:PAC2 family protein [SAR202 cluster bacterium]
MGLPPSFLSVKSKATIAHPNKKWAARFHLTVTHRVRLANLRALCQDNLMKIGAFDVIEPLPELRDAHVISILHPWIDAGNVGTLSLVRLEQHFGAQQIAHLTTPGVFFDFTRYRPVTKMVDGKRTLTIPNTTVSLARQSDGPDILLCRVYEPHSFADAYIDSIHELFKALKVKRHTRLGGMWARCRTRVPYS